MNIKKHLISIVVLVFYSILFTQNVLVHAKPNNKYYKNCLKGKVSSCKKTLKIAYSSKNSDDHVDDNMIYEIKKVLCNKGGKTYCIDLTYNDNEIMFKKKLMSKKSLLENFCKQKNTKACHVLALHFIHSMEDKFQAGVQLLEQNCKRNYLDSCLMAHRLSEDTSVGVKKKVESFCKKKKIQYACDLIGEE